MAQGNSVGEAVAAFAEKHMGSKVGRGECWDLARYALDHAQAKWDGGYGFGERVDTGSVQRGDIVQFDRVLIEHRTAQAVSSATMGPHTAIVLQVIGPGCYLLAHQNFGREGRKVSRYELVMDDVKRGTIIFYRPVR